MKKIQIEYERKIKTNQINDVFTTFQKQNKSQTSNYQESRGQKKGKSQHQQIQSLKSTLKSITPILSSSQFSNPHSRNNIASSNQKYNLKLDELTKHLQQIANKCYYSPINIKSRTQSNNNQKKTDRIPIQSELNNFQNNLQIANEQLFYKNTKYNKSTELPMSKSYSFVNQQLNKKSLNKSIHHLQKSAKQSIDRTTSQKKKSKNKSITKQQIIQEVLNKPAKTIKNLTKLFQNTNQSSFLLPKNRVHSEIQHQRYETIYSSQQHRHRITHIAMADYNHEIYTSSLDYSIKQLRYQNGDYFEDIVQTHRAGVQNFCFVNQTIYSVGRDCYIRSNDNNFYYRMPTAPKQIFFNQNNSLIVSTLQSLAILDIQNRSIVSSIHMMPNMTLLPKQQTHFLAGSKNGVLNTIDWRIKVPLFKIYKIKQNQIDEWINNQGSDTIGYLTKNKIHLIDNLKMEKQRSIKLGLEKSFITYHCNNQFIYYAQQIQENHIQISKLSQKSLEISDIDRFETNDVCLMKVKGPLTIFGHKNGRLTLRQVVK